MIVFRGFMRLVWRNRGQFLLYLTIFITLCVTIQAATKGKGFTQFEEERLNIAVIDLDGGILAKGLTDYLGNLHNLIDVEHDKAVIQDAMFYRNIYYVVTIPDNFAEVCLEDGEKLPATKLPGSSSSFYVDQQIDTFLNDVRVLTDGGFSMEEAVREVDSLGEVKSEVTLIDKNGHGGNAAPYAFMFQFMPYIILASLCYVMGSIMILFKKQEVRRRMLCSSISARKQNAQIVLSYLAVGMGFFILCILLASVMYGSSLLSDPNLPYYLFNVFLLILVALAISFVVGVAVEKEIVVNGVVNVLSLGMCFTCGVFVSMDILGKGVKTAAHFLPIYWYEIVNEIISSNMDFTDVQRWQIYKSYGIQFLFAAAILGVGLIISKNRERE